MRDTAPFVLDAGLPTVKSMPAEGDLIIEGYAADFEVDREGEAFLAGAFDEACKRATRDEIPLLFEHDNSRQLGVVEQLRVDEKGLWTRARIAESAKSAWEGAATKIDQIRRGMLKGLSVRGLSYGKHTPQGPRIGHIDLAEISVTPVPMQPGALFAVAEKSMAYAEGGAEAAPDIAWAAGVNITSEVLQEEAARAIEEYCTRRFAEIHAAFDRVARSLRDY